MERKHFRVQYSRHRIVHWEDTQRDFDITKLYKFVTGDVSVTVKYKGISSLSARNME